MKKTTIKRVLYTIIFLLIFILKSNADVTPQYISSVNHWGIGAAAVSKDIKIYSTDKTNSKIAAHIIWDERGKFECQNTKMRCEAKEIFLAFSPEQNSAMLSVEDENDEWIYVCYNQRFKLFGWIKKDENTKYLTWSELLLSLGRKNGMYLFRDIPKESKRLYAGPSLESGCVDSFILANHITPWLVRGNWVLVKVENYDNTQKTGWLRYRTDSGRLLGFVNLK